MSFTPITPGVENPDPTADFTDIDAAFQRVFGKDSGTGPDRSFIPPADPNAGIESPPSPAADDDPANDPPESPREEGGGEGVVSPDPSPTTTEEVDRGPGGPTELSLDDTGGDGFKIADDPDVGLAPETPATPTPAETLQREVDLNTLMDAYLGRPMSPDESRELLTLIQDLQSGNVQLVDPRQVAQQQAPAPVATPSSSPATPARDPWADDTDDSTSPLPADVQAALDEMREFKAQQEAAATQQWQNWVLAEQRAAAETFTPEIPLSTEELIVLEQRASASGVFALEMQRTQGQNPRQAWATALEQTLYADPTFRDRVIEARVAAQTQSSAADTARQSRAASIAAGGGSTPNATPETRRPRTMDEAKAGATEDLKKLFAYGQPGT